MIQMCEQISFGIVLLLAEIGAVTSGFKCEQCRDADVCETVVGSLRHTVMGKGYNPVVDIPRGACNINVTEADKSNNVLALKAGNVFVINGNWKTDAPGDYTAAETIFRYRKSERPCPGECFRAVGPTLGKVIIQLLYHDHNPGVYYSYQVARHLKHLPDDPNVKSELREGSIGYKDLPDEKFTINEPGTFPIFVPIPGGRGIHHRGPVFSSDFTYRRKPNNTRRQRNRNKLTGGSNSQRRQSLTDVTYSRGEGETVHRLHGEGSVHISPETSTLYGEVVEGSGDGLVSVLDQHSWRLKGYTECTRPCGGGMQETVYDCVDTYTLHEVDAGLCGEAAVRPENRHRVCNAEPCTPSWYTDPWSPCSVTCGQGQRTRVVTCQQRISATDSQIIAESYCSSRKPATSRDCFRRSCYQWWTGVWGECTADCGLGSRVRTVECRNEVSEVSDRQLCGTGEPASKEACGSGTCTGTKWFFTDWTSSCSAECGGGVETRSIHCATDGGHFLPDHLCTTPARPAAERPCKQTSCGGQWFTGPWSKCSQTCGTGVKSRAVICMRRHGGGQVIADASECHLEERPKEAKPCREVECGNVWFKTDWSECSKPCGGGLQQRAVRCMAEDEATTGTCADRDRPRESQVCNTQPCSSWSTQDLHRGGCRDRYPNCGVVVEANLCRYPYYQRKCCRACAGTRTVGRDA
ncbi:THSD4-like protein [Mya arenaria]|uniref:THSD4-like protein n=1 Tax=Mya arenaria TaxID=6604 RepID=A0ABY7DUJ3_MYAAR|nr:thrombospondin type-1 domain-containing protein 4-like isoform X2 [Mya arenaria]WAR00554.1 THSD4-like protein [Mya arenaria]